jgi:hypothetical protein
VADPALLRDQVVRLLTLALKARKSGDLELTDQPIDKALQYEDEADAMKKAAASKRAG